MVNVALYNPAGRIFSGTVYSELPRTQNDLTTLKITIVINVVKTDSIILTWYPFCSRVVHFKSVVSKMFQNETNFCSVLVAVRCVDMVLKVFKTT